MGCKHTREGRGRSIDDAVFAIDLHLGKLGCISKAEERKAKPPSDCSELVSATACAQKLGRAHALIWLQL
jgi:hypothetical protein